MSNYNTMDSTAITEANSLGYGNTSDQNGKSAFIASVPNLTDLSSWGGKGIIAGAGGVTAGQTCLLTANSNGTYTATASTAFGAWFVAQTTASVGLPVVVRAVGVDSVNATASATITAGQQSILTGALATAKSAAPSTASGANWVSASALSSGQAGEFFYRAVRKNSRIAVAQNPTGGNDIMGGQSVNLTDSTQATFGDLTATIAGAGTYTATDDIPAGQNGIFYITNV